MVEEEFLALYESNVFELIFRTTECGELFFRMTMLGAAIYEKTIPLLWMRLL